MAEYKLREFSDGVIYVQSGMGIPNDPSNRHWRKYLKWVADGGVPDPAKTPEEIINQELLDEITTLKSELKNAVVWQFRMILELFKIGKDKALWNNTDVDPDTLSKATSWIAALDRLKVIDE